MEDSPVLVMHGKPLAVSRADVDVERAEVIVLLVARGPGARHLHVQLHRVHAQYRVANVGQEVRLRAGNLPGRKQREEDEVKQLRVL